MKRNITSLILILCLLLTVLPTQAQSQSTLVPDDARFALVLNPSRIMQSKLGQTILERIRLEEPQIDSIIDEFSNTVGIDLRNSLGQTVLFGSGYDKKQFALVADIGPSAGNISGLLLTAPEYSSEVYRDKVIIHSILTEDPMGQADRLYCAIPKRSFGDSYYLVASFDPKRTRDMVDQTMDANAKLMSDGDDQGTLLQAWFNGLPELAQAARAEGPPSRIAEMIQRGQLTLKEAGENATVTLKLTMTDALRAEQVYQLLQGGLAMMQLVASSEPEARPLGELGQLIKVNYTPNDTVVVATMTSSFEQLEELISKLEGMDHHQNNHHPKAAPVEVQETEETVDVVETP